MSLSQQHVDALKLREWLVSELDLRKYTATMRYFDAITSMSTQDAVRLLTACLLWSIPLPKLDP